MCIYDDKRNKLQSLIGKEVHFETLGVKVKGIATKLQESEDSFTMTLEHPNDPISFPNSEIKQLKTIAIFSKKTGKETLSKVKFFDQNPSKTNEPADKVPADKVYAVYKTDVQHSYASRDLIGIGELFISAFDLCKKQAKKEGYKISVDDEFNLRHISQTQGYEGPGEFVIEELTLNVLF